jgi:PII-like signaling protein
MEIELTKQDILELFAEQSKQLKKQSDEFHQRLLEGDKRLERSQTDFDKKLGQLAGTWGKFVAEMVKPKIVELFKEKGIQIETTIQSVEGFKDGQKYYEIDLLLINTDVAVVVEVKSSLSIDDVNEHLERIEKIRKVSPKRIDLSGITIYGAVAGMIVEGEADKYAYKKGLFVLRQRGNIVEIVNDFKFKPKEWKVEY